MVATISLRFLGVAQINRDNSPVQGLRSRKAVGLLSFYLNGCPDFETWLLYERERWQQRVMQMLETLILHERERGAYRQALHYATMLLQFDSFSEVAHRHVMLLLALDGQRSASLAQ